MALRTRREFLKIAGFTSAALGSAKLLYPPALYASATDSSRQELIAAVARAVFPHERVPMSPYGEIARRITRQADSSPDTSGVVEQGIVRIRRLSAPDTWLQMSAAEQAAVLEELDGGPFFNLLRTTAVQVLYRSPEVWQLIGYGGNAIEQGGYLDSFNDIDWLPE